MSAVCNDSVSSARHALDYSGASSAHLGAPHRERIYKGTSDWLRTNRLRSKNSSKETALPRSLSIIIIAHDATSVLPTTLRLVMKHHERLGIITSAVFRFVEAVNISVS